MTAQKKIGLFGFGTVGTGFYEILRKQPQLGASIEKVCVKRLDLPRIGHDLYFTNDPSELLDDPEIDIIVEVIDDAITAKEYVKTALSHGKSVISANKKMIAESLTEIDQWHKTYQARFLYEAAVGGGIPIVHTMDSFFRDQEVVKIRGILNGSSNYILTKMQQNQWQFDQALQEAQVKGFAERNPTLDVTGVDASYKLSILAYHAFGDVPSLSQFSAESIENISKESLKKARTKGKKIKPIATIEKSALGIKCEVKAEAIGPNDDLYSVDFENNAISVETLTSGKHTFSGKGAGSLPTGLAVMEDLKRLVSGYRYQVAREIQYVA